VHAPAALPKVTNWFTCKICLSPSPPEASTLRIGTGEAVEFWTVTGSGVFTTLTLATGGPFAAAGAPNVCAEHSIEIEANAARTALTTYFIFRNLVIEPSI
jgi:hypothetical protein